MRRVTLTTAALLGIAVTTPALAEVPVTLRGSSGSMERQNAVAKGLDLNFAETTAQVAELEGGGALVCQSTRRVWPWTCG